MWYITRRYLRLAVLTWGPVLALMSLLFISSAQPKITPPGTPPDLVYLSGAMPVFPGVLDTLIKKSAHFIVYGLLGLLAMRACIHWGIEPRQAMYFAITLTAAYALSDELHQAFIPGRHPSGIDIGLDFAGAATFALSYRAYHHRTNSSSTGKIMF